MHIAKNDFVSRFSNSVRVEPPNDEIYIAVMGATGSGKTSFINLLSPSNLRVGSGLRSCTNDVQAAMPFNLDNRRVRLIDTPGFDDSSKSDTEILKMIAAFLSTTYESNVRLTGVIYMYRISDNRAGGISRRNFSMFRQLCGDETLKNVAIVTNMWSKVTPQEGQAREDELRKDDMHFKPVLDKEAQLLRHLDTVESAQSIILKLIGKCPVTLRIQQELVHQRLNITETAAGAELNQELMEQERRHMEDLSEMKLEMEEAIRLRDDVSRQELELETQKLQEEMMRVRGESQRLAFDYSEEKDRVERQMQEMAEAARREAALYQQQMDALNVQFIATATQSAAEKAAMLERMDELQRKCDEARRGGGCIIS